MENIPQTIQARLFTSLSRQKNGDIAETSIPVVTCTTLERAKKVQSANFMSFLHYEQEISTHRFYCCCNTKRPEQCIDLNQRTANTHRNAPRGSNQYESAK
jgi:hypothetical protein